MEGNTGLVSRRYAATAGLALLAGLYLTSLYNFPLFHTLAELFSIAVACGLFMVVWNTRRLIDNHYFLFIGTAYLFVVAVDLLHTLSYKGMGVFIGYGANLPTQLWIVARYLEAFSLLAAPLFIRRKLNMNAALPAYTFALAVLLVSVFTGYFPDCFIEGVGLTPFKKGSEYVISLVLLGALALLYRNRGRFERPVYQVIAVSIGLRVVSELFFTFYVSVYGLSNLVGHYLKIVAFYLMYKAIIETGLTRPFSLLFRDLKHSEEALRGALAESKARGLETGALLKASRSVLESKDFYQAARSIFDYSREVTGASAGYVALLSPDGQENEVLFLDSGGLPCSVDPLLPMPIRGLRGEAYRTGNTVYDNNFAGSGWLKFMPDGHVGLENVLFAPLKFGDKTVGLLGLANKPGGFTENDARMATAFGDLASVALQNSRTMEALVQSLKDKDALMREIHHRVKNNFIIVYSLLKFQARRLKDNESAALFKESQDRVMSMSLIHEKLYRSGDLASIGFSGYVTHLAQHLFRSYSVDPGRVRLRVDVPDVPVEADTMVPCGLIINELISNALKYAFPGGREGEVSVEVRPLGEDGFVLTVRDDGVGLPEGFDLSHPVSLGFELVNMLASQLGGGVEVDRSNGTEFRITLKRAARKR